MLMREEAEFDLAIRLRQGKATVAEIYTFISGLYFRGKLAYVEMFGAAPEGVLPAAVIVPGAGLVPPDRSFLTINFRPSRTCRWKRETKLLRARSFAMQRD